MGKAASGVWDKDRTKNHTTGYICEKSDCVSYIKRRFLEMKMDYRRDLQHNYITRMMTENQVQGLLGCECRRMDQKKLYYYDITSKISLAEKSRLKKVKGSEVLLIIQGLLQVLVQLEEYLIPASVWTGIIFILILSAVIPLFAVFRQRRKNWNKGFGNFWKSCFQDWITRNRPEYR